MDSCRKIKGFGMKDLGEGLKALVALKTININFEQ